MNFGLRLLERLEQARGIQLAEQPSPSPDPRLAWRSKRVRQAAAIAQVFSCNELDRQIQQWKAEIREWAEPIWRARKDTLRMRARRQQLLDGRDFFPDMSPVEYANLVARSRSDPTKWAESKRHPGCRIARTFEYDDDPMRPISQEDLEYLAEPWEDVRSIRRLVKDAKRAQGGVEALDPRLFER